MNGSRPGSVPLVVALVCARFALRSLWPINAMALRSDDFYIVDYGCLYRSEVLSHGKIL